MSSQRGNIQKKGPPKHQNKTAFKNTLHDTSKRTKQIVSLDVTGVCQRCKDVIDWKIKYKKYKPLTQAKKCVKCQQPRSVKVAYYTYCFECSTKLDVCAKCGAKKEVVLQANKLSASELASEDRQLQFEIENMSERQRRTFLRLQAQGKLKPGMDLEDMCNDSDCEDDDDDINDNAAADDDDDNNGNKESDDCHGDGSKEGCQKLDGVEMNIKELNLYGTGDCLHEAADASGCATGDGQNDDSCQGDSNHGTSPQCDDVQTKMVDEHTSCDIKENAMEVSSQSAKETDCNLVNRLGHSFD